MCFPTPRDSTTDLVNTLFNAHVNLSPTNKSVVMEKIIQARADFILFADAALDSRVFALAHERLALHQGRVESSSITSILHLLLIYLIQLSMHLSPASILSISSILHLSHLSHPFIRSSMALRWVPRHPFPRLLLHAGDILAALAMWIGDPEGM